MASSPEINRFNEQWRASPQYRQILQQVGANPDGPLQLTDRQRKQVKTLMEQAGFQIPKGEIDPAGNVNEDEGFSKHAKWIIPAAIGLGTMGLGAAGIGPLAGVLGGGGGGAAAGGAATGGALASSAVPTSLAMGAVPGAASTIGGGVAGAMGGLGAAGAASSGVGGLLGALGRYSGPLGDIGSVVSGAARGSADQRVAEMQGLLQQQQMAQQGARDQFSAGMQGAQFQREGQDRARRQALLTQLLNNTQDANIQPGNPAIAARMGTSTGGARPSNLTTNREALLAILGQPQVAAPTFTPPPPFQLPRAGAAENILGGLGTGMNIAGAIGKFWR